MPLITQPILHARACNDALRERRFSPHIKLTKAPPATFSKIQSLGGTMATPVVPSVCSTPLPTQPVALKTFVALTTRAVPPSRSLQHTVVL